MPARLCRVCGCSEFQPCSQDDYWVEDNLCSTCASKPEKHERPLRLSDLPPEALRPHMRHEAGRKVA